MAGIAEIQELLTSMSPKLQEGKYVFCTVDGSYADYAQLNPMGTFIELIAAVSEKLASRGISANVVAAYYHDHIYVQSEKVDEALAALHEFGATT